MHGLGAIEAVDGIAKRYLRHLVSSLVASAFGGAGRETGDVVVH